MTLIEGKNREIRKIMNFFNLNVLKLKRIKYGPFSLGNLKSGEYKKVSEKRLISCLKVLGFKVLIKDRPADVGISAIFSFILSSEGYVQAVAVSQFRFTLELALLPKVTVLVP